MTLVAVFLGLVFLHGLVSRRLAATLLTAPMLFTAAGLAASRLVPGATGGGEAPEVFLAAAELGLVLLLFTDASRTDLAVLRRARSLPVRLLTTGLLLTLALGTLAALGLFPDLALWEAGVLAAILAPTDAGLGQDVVTDPRVPAGVRQALGVEAGLNDGLSVPFLLFFLALGAQGAGDHAARLLPLVVEQLGYGALLGLALGGLGGLLLGAASRRQTMAEGESALGIVALPLLCAVASEAVGASMFIAAFVAGLAVQRGFPAAGRHAVELTEGWGRLINLAVFFLFGLLAARALPQVRTEHVLYAVASLTVVRLLPVWLALRGTGLRGSTVAFMGWFGPRGLASIVLGLVYLEHVGGDAARPTVRLATVATVLASIFVHGATTRPGIAAYAARVEGLDPRAPERGA